MKAHTSEFKQQIALHGRELDGKITYTYDNEQVVLGSEQLNSITPHYQGDILKSVMKQLDLESTVFIPVGTEINCQIGIKVNDAYEYLNFGNYTVYSIEKNEDTNSYRIVCYDKLIRSMVDYEHFNSTYPISIRDYIGALCTHLGLTFKNANETFANYDKEIQQELYMTYNEDDDEWKTLGYTYRDVFDELAAATASTICINSNEQLEIRYITSTNDTIDEEYLKDVNVDFGEKYGPVNSIVLSRSAEADNVFINDPSSIAQNGLCELKIVDNQILNWNDRSTYLPDMLSRLGGLEFYLNDYTSTGILYYDLCDRYSVKIGNQYYNCVMFNDDIFVTQGMYENIHTDKPLASETDYTKADKTDRRINQTYLIVDKQNQKIEGVITSVGQQNTKISTLTQTVDDLMSQISDIADLTTSGESSYASVDLDHINASEPITVKINPTTSNISRLYPYNVLYPQDTLYPKERVLRFYNKTTEEIFDYTLPDDLLYYDSENYDSFFLSYEDQTCQITKKCKYNADGTVGLLDELVVTDYPYPTIDLTDGNYTISIYGTMYGYIFVRLMSQNLYTTQFYTKAETNSIISQTTGSINLSVDQKLSNYSTTDQMNSAISIKANEINSTVSETYSTKSETTQAKTEAINSANGSTDNKLQNYSTTVQMNSAINQKANQITTSVSETYATKSITNSLSSRINQTARSIDLSVTDNGTSAGLSIKVKNEDGTQIDSDSANITMSGLVKFVDLSTSGSTTINGANIQTGTLSASKITTGTLNGNNVSITNLKAGNIVSGTLNGNNVSITNLKAGNIVSGTLSSSSVKIGSWNLNGTGIHSSNARLYPDYLGYKIGGTGAWANEAWWRVAQTSDKKAKKNIEKLGDDYEKFFNDLKPVVFEWKKSEGNKKHIGFIAQDVQQAAKENNLDLDMVYQDEGSDFMCLDKKEIVALNTWQIQMMKKEIEDLKEEIKKLKGEK